MLQDRLGLSKRRACRVTGQHRSTQRRQPARGRSDDALRTALRAFSRGHPRWGYRRAWATAPADAGIPRRLCEEGWGVNRKRVQRLWREEGLRVPAKRRKCQRLGDSAQPARRLRAERPNHVWALDFQFDQTADGRVLKLLNIVDEHTREALAVVAARRINADATAATLDRIVAGRGTAPGYIRCDNGPELTANALRDWCRFSGTGSSYIEPGAPWENPYVESFNGRLRDEFLAVEQFDSLLEAQVLIEDWRIEYNTKRPHSSLGWLAPAVYAERWEDQQHPGLSSAVDSRRGSGHLDRASQHPRRPAGAQRISVVDAVDAVAVRQCTEASAEATRVSSLSPAFARPGCVTEVEVGVRQCTEAEPAGERGGEQQARLVHEAVVVEGDVYPLGVTRR